MPTESRGLRLSVVVPVFNEEENVPWLVAAVRDALSGYAEAWELVLVDDGSEDGTAAAAEAASREDRRVRLLRLARNFGQTAAMQAGFDQSRGEVVVSMDGDLQNDPGDIPMLLEKIDEGYDLVVGYRVRRKDTLVTRKVPSWVANRMIQALTGIRIRDNGCSLKAYRRELLDRLFLYSELHRFIPAMAAASAGARIVEVPVRHHARRFGTSKYGLSRFARVLADMLTVMAIRSFRHRPLRLFGLAGMASAALGLLFGTAAVTSFLLFQPVKANAVVLPAAALLTLGLSGYLVMLGLIAEVAVRVHERVRQPLPIVFEVRP